MKIHLQLSLRQRDIRVPINLYGAILILCGLVYASFRLGNQQADLQQQHLLRVAQAQASVQQQVQQVENLRAHSQQTLTGMLMKLGDLQAQIRRLDALGLKLAQGADLPVDEFGFGELPATGGPSAEMSDFVVEDSQEVVAKINQVLLELENKNKQLTALESIMLNHHIDEQSYLAGRPIKSGWLSSYYGVRKDPFSGQPAMHKGLDFAGKEGDPVIATGAGVVTWAGERYGYGNLIEIDHGDGLVTRYGHNQSLTVALGDVVTKGQQVGVMGSTGRSTGAHVHYEVIRNGVQQDPLPYVSRR